MTCPLYNDYTRECVNKYKRVLKVPTYTVCNSDDFDECPMYEIIVKKVECCEFTPKCDEDMNFAIWDYELLKYIANNFCFHGKKVNCAIFKLRNEGKEIPEGLQPDGKIVELKS